MNSLARLPLRVSVHVSFFFSQFFGLWRAQMADLVMYSSCLWLKHRGFFRFRALLVGCVPVLWLLCVVFGRVQIQRRSTSCK